MRSRVGQSAAGYPRQFWFLFWGMLINSAGGSMVWPFLTIYLRQRLGIPLTTVALLLTVNAGAGLLTTLVGGPVVAGFLGDRLAPSAMWWGGASLALLAAGGFALLFRAASRRKVLWESSELTTGPLGP